MRRLLSIAAFGFGFYYLWNNTDQTTELLGIGAMGFALLLEFIGRRLIDSLDATLNAAICAAPAIARALPLSAIGPFGSSLYDSFSSVIASDIPFSRPGGKSTGTIASPSSPTKKSAAQIGAPCLGIHQMR